tara:strand:- start:417 stop:542 length:126 start_codon:yes stop_codon:yes gene_type:complete
MQDDDHNEYSRADDESFEYPQIIGLQKSKDRRDDDILTKDF